MKELTIQKISKHFGGVNAVDNVTVNFPPGKITGIIGPNGSGKSTIINVLSGLMEKDEGSIYLKGEDVGVLPAYKRSTKGITRTFQEIRLWNQISVLDNILVTMTERRVYKALFEKQSKKHEEVCKALLKKVDLWEKRNEHAEKLSYGQRKLLEVARALGTDAEVYLFDEPFAGLFPEMVKKIVAIIKELREERKTVILIEHNIELIRELSDHLIVMDSGKVLAEGIPEEVLQKREVIEAYLGE